MNVAITGGGTGGHLSIAKALALECRKMGIECIYIGSNAGQDRAWFENSEIFGEKYFLDTTGVVNKRGLRIFKAIFLQIRAILKAGKILKNHKIDFVLSVGGFSAGGAACASVLRGIPLFIHEQNAYIGTLNKILSPFAKAVFSSFDLGLKNQILTSYPINAEFFKAARIRREIKTILFLGGSQGAVALNSFALELAPILQKKGINIIHQCGKIDLERMQTEYQKLGFRVANHTDFAESTESIESKVESKSTESMKSADLHTDSALDSTPNSPQVDLFAFDNNLIEKIKKADFCVSRAGASSLWELCANNLPAYFIPYPYAAKNHQYFNALALKKRNLCGLINQSDLNVADFLSYIDKLDLATQSGDLKKQISPNGTKEIIDKILEILREKWQK
ncbi:hypothetical protein CCY99_00510 [Helicobacter sp. 16-1353]|uniref:UDP-N-acetylglucosamine--N-acetylmuramyl- (pentapeptide) pyrophosphoryl-undecaprenol N-acetylglucosamine transferase n=1 Tax=Helicobacter sp. 16-1353 TaxID=2004996 RepID=UPI000DCCA41D|nr:UDP-N-acetylglucosamine--N-acetylmuramyl-(pentapeptide) pyrophosphoryl-undecaprenol N-acetylglucosamine transferase [Helicobacter sp. 16-1353]RAX55214.1 hypothetical protein CCY99_00510 [Helicobacter sp. 16-1353]